MIIKQLYEVRYFLLIIVFLGAGCGGSRENEPRKQVSAEREMIKTVNPADYARVKALLTSTQNDLHRQTQELVLTRDKLNKLDAKFQISQEQNQQASKVIKDMAEHEQIVQAKLMKSQAALAKSSQLLKNSDQKNTDAEAKLREWADFYKEYESQIREYNDYIQQQRVLIDELSTEQSEQIQLNDVKMPNIPKRLTPSGSGAISRRQFFAVVQGMTTDELRDYIGAPSKITGSAPRYYIYNKPHTYYASKDKEDSLVKISIKDGHVKECFFK